MQCSEGMNTIVKMKIRTHYTLLDFFGNFESVLRAMQEKKNHLDHQDTFSPLSLATTLPIEKSLLGVYTSQVFLDFQKEVLHSLEMFVVEQVILSLR